MTPAGRIDRRHDRGPVVVEHADDLRRRPGLAERRERGEVGEQDAYLALLPAKPGDLGSAFAQSLRHDGRQVRPERRIEALDLAGRLGEERDLLVRRPIASQVGHHPIGRFSPCIRGDDGRHGLAIPAIDPRQGGFQVQAPEGGRERTAPPILAPSPQGDGREGRQQQDVPFPPAGVPVAAQGDGDRRFGEQDERDGDAEQQRPAAAPIQQHGSPGRIAIQRDRDDRQQVQQPGAFPRRRWTVQRWQAQDRDHRPGEHHEQEAAKEVRPQTQDRPSPRACQGARGRRGEHGGDDESHGRRDGEPDVGGREQHARRRERVQAEESGARQERQ